ncbi:hypothetical protein CEXT_327291 [Caerostris extrusa]|uniref:BED-type domain-containing protein n=1 Tax=Caerostris extrusa TaxID=172846 RepID=A0AAV4PEC5_CAEEX|nr:hypothetical protein CEXT_327291 [Caerostris extrusa]
MSFDKIPKKGNRKFKSNIWSFYNRKDNGGICKICGKEFNIQEGSTTNMWNHLRRKHKEQLSAFKENRLHNNNLTFQDISNGRLSLNKNNSSSSETTVFPVSGSVTCMDKNGQTYYIFPVSAESLQSSDIKIDSFETIPTIIEAESVQTVCIAEDELFHMPVVETEPIQSMTVVEDEAVQNISVTEAGPVQNISLTEVETIQNIPATETKPVLKSSVKESNSVIGNVPSIELNCEDASVPEETGTSKSSTPIVQICHAYSKSNSPKKSVTYSTNPTCERLSIDGKTKLNRASHFEPVHAVKSNSNNRNDPSHCLAEYLASMLRKIPKKHCIQLQNQIISMICKEYSKFL